LYDIQEDNSEYSDNIENSDIVITDPGDKGDLLRGWE